MFQRRGKHVLKGLLLKENICSPLKVSPMRIDNKGHLQRNLNAANIKWLTVFRVNLDSDDLQ